MSEVGSPTVDELEERLEQVEFLLEEDPRQALEVLEKLREAHPEEEVIVLMMADALASTNQPKLARHVLQEWLAAHPQSADAHHALGVLLDWLGDYHGSIAAFCETHRLDDENWRKGPPLGDAFEEHLLQVVRHTVQGLPDQFRKPLGSVPIVIEDRPSLDLVEQGFDPRSLGLFEGATHGEQRSVEVMPSPTRIVLYAANLAAEFPEAEELDEEVRITVLHEVGHFFGLDEERLAELGLD